MKHRPVSRRHFLRSATVASAATLAFPHVLRSQGGVSSNSRLNIACIGVGGRGHHHVTGLKDENLVAFCDVDQARAAPTFQEFPDIPRYLDYREMFDRIGNTIDAVSICTPDHMHFPIAMTAMALGKHVHVEKPMGHTIAEVRRLAEVARERRVATQMGIQGHAGEGVRLLKEWFDAGILGEVREVHTWSDRPIWPQGLAAPDHTKFIPVVPPGLAWDLWLGVASPRPFDPSYVPFTWRGYWDFGTGAAGDMGCHLVDGVFWALQLGAPASVEAISSGLNEVSAPKASVVTYHFPGRGSLPPVKWMWYDGGLKPPLPTWFDAGRSLSHNGSLVIGSNASVYAPGMIYESVRLVPEARMRDLAPSLPEKTIERVPEADHFKEWVRACKDGPPAGANFDYSAPLTELVLLSNVALRCRRRIEWDSAAMRVTNVPDANQFLAKTYRSGFGV